MRRWILVLLLMLLVPTALFSQAGHLEIARIMMGSAEYHLIKNGCLLGFDRTAKRFKCIEPEISISRSAGALNLAITDGAPLFQGEPQYASFPNSAKTCAGFDFVMPTQALEAVRLRLVNQMATADAGVVKWDVYWCRYAAGQAACALPGSPNASTTTTVGVTTRLDTAFSLTTGWGPLDAVVGRVCRDGNHATDTTSATARLQFLQLELLQSTGG